MPGYVIHLAAGKVYEKYNKIKDIPSFEQGIIAPDRAKDKAKSHYGPYSSKAGINQFLQENNISTDYQEGYFFHLATDYLFYNQFLKQWSPSIYEDYDKLNAQLIKRYGVVLPKEIQGKVKFKEGTPQVLKEEELCRFIDAVGKINIRQIVSQKGVDYKKQILDEIEKI